MTEAEKDAAAARAYFDEWILPGLGGVPEDGVEHLQDRYVKDVLFDPGLRAQMRELYGEKYCSTYCEHNASVECACQPCVFIRTETGFAHEYGCKHAGEEH